MANCVACGGKAKDRRLNLDFCRTCGINFDNRLQKIINSTDNESLENNYLTAIKAIESRDHYTNSDSKKKVLTYFKNAYIEKKTGKQQKREDGLAFEIQGVRGRYLEVFHNKVVITTSASLGSFVTGNLTDGKKTIYFKDIIGLQFKPSGALIGYLQFETAAPTMNNEKSNFFNENTFTFDESTTSNKKMIEIEEYIDKQLEKIKSTQRFSSNADEIRRFKALLDENIISQEEFDSIKKSLLDL